MKKLLIVLMTMGLALGASAQRFGHAGGYRGRGYHVARPHVIIGVGAGIAPFYPYYGYGGYSPFGYPYFGYGGGYGYGMRPSRLELQVQDIRLDYADRIKSVRMDRTLKGHQRRQIVRQLKTDRDRAIVDAKRNYYYNRSSSGRTPSANGSKYNNNANNNYSE